MSLLDTLILLELNGQHRRKQKDAAVQSKCNDAKYQKTSIGLI